MNNKGSSCLSGFPRPEYALFLTSGIAPGAECLPKCTFCWDVRFCQSDHGQGDSLVQGYGRNVLSCRFLFGSVCCQREIPRFFSALFSGSCSHTTGPVVCSGPGKDYSRVTEGGYIRRPFDEGEYLYSGGILKFPQPPGKIRGYVEDLGWEKRK